MSSLVADRRGAALIEFALILPAMLLLYLGGFMLADMIARSRKVTIVTRTLADLVAQNATGTTTPTELDNELAAASQVFAPYSASPSGLRVSEVYTDYNYNTTVKWSRALRAQPYLSGVAYSLPNNLRVPGSYLLISDASYAYVPPMTYKMVTARTLQDHLIMLPRNTSSVDCGAC